MADTDIKRGEPVNGSGNRPVKQAAAPTQPRTTAKPRTAKSRSAEPAKVEPQETPYILNEVTSDVARENVDIRLKSAQVESLPDENVLVAGAATMLLLLLNGVGMMAFGDYARLNDTERAMIEEPLTRILAKVSPASLNLIGKYSDPVLLTMGLLAWFSRVSMESKRRKEATAKPEPKEPTPEVLTPAPPQAADMILTTPPNEIISNMNATGIIL